MTDTATLPAAGTRVLYGLLALVLSAGWLVAAALPAAGAQDWGVQSPGSGEVITGSFTTTGYVVTFQEQRVDAVRTRFRRGDQPVGPVRNLEKRGDSQDAGLPGQTRSTWEASTSVGDMPNGRYVVEVSVVNTIYPEGSPWRGHEVVVDVAPTAKLETVRVADAASRRVEVRWARTSAPAADHVRYVLQRAQGGGDFTDVHTARAVDDTVHTDIVPELGDYRYRVKTVRLAADGSEREAVSGPANVSVQSGASGRPETGEEPDGPLGERGDPPAGEAEPAPGSGGPSTPRLSARSPSGGRSAPSSTSTRSQRPNVSPPLTSNDTFEETLDYGVDLPEWERSEDEILADAGGFDDGGTLTVFGGQEMSTEQVVVPVAGGLVLTLFGLHIVRFLRTDA